MERSILASEARDLTRQIFASLPFTTKLGYAANLLVRLAFSDDATTLGVALLYAFNRAGTPGDVDGEGGTIDKYAPALKRGLVGPLKAPAKNLGSKAIHLARTFKKTPPDIQDDALGKTLEFLQKKGFGPQFNVGQALTYVAKVLNTQALLLLRSRDRHEKGRDALTPEAILETIGDTGTLPPRDLLNRIDRELKTNPLFLADGQPRVRVWMDGLMSGKTMIGISEMLGMDAKALKEWLHNPTRWRGIQRLLTPLLDHYQDQDAQSSKLLENTSLED